MAERNQRPSLAWLKDLLEMEAVADEAAMPRPDRADFDADQVKACSSGSVAKARAVLAAVVEHGPRMLKDLERARAAGNTETVLELVHDLRGLAQIVGAYAVARGCLRVELAYEAAAPEDRRQLVADLAALVDPLFDAIRRYLASWAA